MKTTINYWSLTIETSPVRSGVRTSLGNFIFGTVSPEVDVSSFTASLGNESIYIYHKPPSRIDEIDEELLSKLEPCFSNDDFKVWRINLSEQGGRLPRDKE